MSDSSSSPGFLTIVSGLPRSGTSMMMRMLAAGGMEVLTDNVRQPNEDNPLGYYEFEPVKRTKADPTWLVGSDGKAVKMVYRLLYDLPSDRQYRVLLMQRRLAEVLASQQVMLGRTGEAQRGAADQQMEKLFQSDIKSFHDWAARQAHVKVLVVDYNNMQNDPHGELAQVNEFLSGGLDIAAMAKVVDGSLYRNRR